jgi:hypothetical protein
MSKDLTALYAERWPDDDGLRPMTLSNGQQVLAPHVRDNRLRQLLQEQIDEQEADE